MSTTTPHPSGSLHPLVGPWDGWTKHDLEAEIKTRMAHFYGQTDGTMKFPSSAEGDLLKMVHALFQPPPPTKCPDCYGTGYEEIDHGHYPCPRGCRPNAPALAQDAQDSIQHDK